jgi:hypothetical protein
MGGYCFVSCWTYESEESIPMWDMYADSRQGVRIEMPIEMFDISFNINKNDRSLTPLFEVDNECVLPELIDVDYGRTNDPCLTISFFDFDLDNLGKYKLSDWKFQKECRFRIFGSRINNQDSFFSYSYIKKWGINCIEDPIKQKSVKFVLNEDAINQMRIMVGPEMPEGKRILFEALMEKYKIDDSRVTKSKFTEHNDS